MKKLILVVCNGNIHRSVIAEHCINRALRRIGLERKYLALSRGLQGTAHTPPPQHRNLRQYPLEWEMSKPLFAKFGVTIPKTKVATPISRSIVKKATVILAMDRRVLLERPNSLVRQFPFSGFKIRMFRELEGRTDDVPDSFGQQDARRYRQTISLIHTIVHTRIKHLIALAEHLTISDTQPSQTKKGKI